MALTVRLGSRAERTLAALAKRKRMSRSDVVREAIVRYGASEGADGAADGPYGAWMDVIGVVSIGARNPRQTTGEQFAAGLDSQRRARRPR